MYGATSEEKLSMTGKLKAAPKRRENEYVIDTHVMNIYTNPTEQMLQSGAITALQRMQESHDVIPSIHGDQSCDVNKSQTEADNLQNHELEEGAQYLEPVKHASPPQIRPLKGNPNKALKHDPNRALPDPHGPQADTCDGDYDTADHVYEDDELTEENVYSDITDDIIYEDIDELKKNIKI